MMELFLASSLTTLLVVGSGCGLLVDGAYRLGNGTSSEVVAADTGTGLSETRIEYQAEVDAEGSPRLRCHERTRGIERGWTVTKHYEYRGGYEKGAYTATAVVDGLLGALVAGTMLGICSKEDSDVSCVNAAWASPFAIGLVYSLIRRSQARPRVLVNKTSSGDRMQYGEAVHESETQCQTVVSLHLGRTSGPNNEQRLNGQGGTDVRELEPDSIQLGLAEDAHILLPPEALGAWAESSSASLWIRDTSGDLQPVLVDRCAVLRPQLSSVQGQAYQNLTRECAQPSPPQE